MPKSGITWDSTEMTVKCASIRSKIPDVAGRALYDELEEVEVPECQAEVPYLTGALHDTIRVEGPFFNHGWISANIVAGDDTVNYAIPVHEDLDRFHPHGKAKFIQDPLFASRPFIGARIAERMHFSTWSI